MLVSVDEEWQFSEYEDSKISGYTFNFKRLFEGRVVRNNRNNLYISTDGNGLFKDGLITVQDLKTTTEMVAVKKMWPCWIRFIERIHIRLSFAVCAKEGRRKFK